MSEIEFTSRYGSGPLPDHETMCEGDCEGMGVVPVHRDDAGDPRYIKAWIAAEQKEPSKDGYHFLKCRDCSGTGKKQK